MVRESVQEGGFSGPEISMEMHRQKSSRASGLVRTSGTYARPSAVSFDGEQRSDTRETLSSLFLFSKKHSGKSLITDALHALHKIPDPPCVMPASQCDADDEDKNPLGYVQIYWKEHAKWLDSWPGTEELRDRNNSFLDSWNTRRSVSVNSDDPGSNRRECRAFVNICHKAIAIRSGPTQDEESKTGDSIHPGECVMIESVQEDAGIRYLKISDGGQEGWAFDSKNGATVMAEMKNLVSSLKWYRIVSKEVVEILLAPTDRRENRSGLVMCPNEIFVVSLMCRVGGGTFVQLADGRGWVSVYRLLGVGSENGALSTRPAAVVEECEMDFHAGQNGSDQRPMVPATNEIVEVGRWTYVVGEAPVLALGESRHGTLISPGDIVKVDKRSIANGDRRVDGSGVMGRMWLRLLDRRGWVPVTGADGRELLTEQNPNQTAYPTWFGGQQINDTPKEDWMIGVA